MKALTCNFLRIDCKRILSYDLYEVQVKTHGVTHKGLISKFPILFNALNAKSFIHGAKEDSPGDIFVDIKLSKLFVHFSSAEVMKALCPTVFSKISNSVISSWHSAF